MASLVVGGLPMAYKAPNLSATLSSRSKSILGVSLSTSVPTAPLISCGRGDRKTKRGKRFNHSYGNARPRNKNKGRGPPRAPAPPGPPRKDPFEALPDLDDDETET